MAVTLSFAASAIWIRVGCVRGGVGPHSLSAVSSLPTHLSPPPRPPGAGGPPNITPAQRDNPPTEEKPHLRDCHQGLSKLGALCKFQDISFLEVIRTSDEPIYIHHTTGMAGLQHAQLLAFSLSPEPQCHSINSHQLHNSSH